MNVGTPAGRDVAKPVRKILRAWSTVAVADYPSTDDGLCQLARLMLMLAIRNKAFLKALGAISNRDIQEDVSVFRDAHQALVGNLSMIRSGQAGVADVADLVASVKQASQDFVVRRESIYAALDTHQRQSLLDAEWAAQVFTDEIARDMDHAAQVIFDSLDEALDSDWLDSNCPTMFGDDWAT
jgi:hypothetical protein